MANLTEKAIPAHRVKVSVGYTRNMGNFESLRVDIGLDMDGEPGASPNKTFDKVYKWCEEKLLEKVAEIDEGLKN